MYHKFNLLMLKVHNLSGVSSLQYKKKKFSVSIPFVIFNISNIIGLVLLRHWIHKDSDAISKILENIFLVHEDSSFLDIIYSIEYKFTHFIEIFLVFINLLRQRKVASFLNDCISVDISGENLMKLQRDVTISSTLIFLYFIADCFVQFVTYYKFNLLAITFNYVEFFPYMLMLSMLIATKNFELFLLAALEKIGSDLKNTNFEAKTEKRRLQKLVENYKTVCGLCERFNEVFGVQLTSMTCFQSLVLTFRVIDSNSMICCN